MRRTRSVRHVGSSLWFRPDPGPLERRRGHLVVRVLHSAECSNRSTSVRVWRGSRPRRPHRRPHRRQHHRPRTTDLSRGLPQEVPRLPGADRGPRSWPADALAASRHRAVGDGPGSLISDSVVPHVPRRGGTACSIPPRAGAPSRYAWTTSAPWTLRRCGEDHRGDRAPARDAAGPSEPNSSRSLAAAPRCRANCSRSAS